MSEVRAKKYLGQHFLTDLSIAQRIAGSLPLDAETDVLEVGPGMGVLTQFLLQDPRVRLTAVELDTESVAYLHRHYPQLHVVEADFLRLNLEQMFPGQFCIIGNFPYNISSQILFRLLDVRDRVPVLCGMFQKEVAERIASPAGRKAYAVTRLQQITQYVNNHYTDKLSLKDLAEYCGVSKEYCLQYEGISSVFLSDCRILRRERTDPVIFPEYGGRPHDRDSVGNYLLSYAPDEKACKTMNQRY